MTDVSVGIGGHRQIGGALGRSLHAFVLYFAYELVAQVELLLEALDGQEAATTALVPVVGVC